MRCLTSATSYGLIYWESLFFAYFDLWVYLPWFHVKTGRSPIVFLTGLMTLPTWLREHERIFAFRIFIIIKFIARGNNYGDIFLVPSNSYWLLIRDYLSLKALRYIFWDLVRWNKFTINFLGINKRQFIGLEWCLWWIYFLWFFIVILLLGCCFWSDDCFGVFCYVIDI